jgi:type I restriction enzyme R subunit
MSDKFTESEVELAALDILSDLGYTVKYGPEIAPAPEGTSPERLGYADVILIERLKSAIEKLNRISPEAARTEALRTILRTESPSIFENNRTFHQQLVNGIDVEYQRADGSITGDKIRLFDFERPENNEFLAVNQFTVIENSNNRRPDIVVFVNGVPLVLIELKNPADEDATIWSAFHQLQTYKTEIPSLFHFNEVLIISDGTEARAGTLTSDTERFMPWKTVGGTEIASTSLPQIEVLFQGMLDKSRLLDLIRHFIVFEEEEHTKLKKLAAYHQYYAVNKAIESTLEAANLEGDKRCGVVWHTQGSGKSLTMAFYAGKLVLALDNPTIVVITDRNDLDDQLFGTFSRCHELLRQTPVQATSRDRLKELLNVAAGGVVFTTIQKFFPDVKGAAYPTLSERRNIVVIADEAHRSQYDFIDGFARHMRDALPNASFIGFTGTPIEKTDRSTLAVFGNYIDIYDIEQAVEDGATVRVYYESRLAKLQLDEEERPHIDPEFEEATESEEVAKKEKLKSKWARLEALVGSEKRLRQIAEDVVNHFEQRLAALDGKGMIVCMSRRICIDLYNEIVALRPEWHSDDDAQGIIKLVMTGSASDPVEWQPHIRNKQRRRKLGERMKAPSNELRLAIVRDMWLTGFDAPSLHTMYVDKPMRSLGLMQAIARVNRVFRDKQGGLVVDYIGIAYELKKALSEYTERDRENTGIPQEEAVAVMLEKYEIVCDLFYGFDYRQFFTLGPREKLRLIPKAMEHILQQEDGKARYLQHVSELSKSFSLAVPHEKALEIRDDVGFFQAVKAAIIKTIALEGRPQEQLDTAVKQILSKAVMPSGVIDVYSVLGLEKPVISILSPEFLEEVKGVPQKNLAFEVLRKLLNDEIRTISQRNVVQGRSFADMLEKSIKRYQNKSIQTAQVIEELIELAKQMREAQRRGEELGLSPAELAFYDALEANNSAVQVLGDDTLRTIAHELVDTIRKNVTIDWTLRENAQALLRVKVKRILKKFGYPPDMQKKATETVLEQAALICGELAEA